MKSFQFERHYVAITLLALLTLRSLAIGASIGDAIALIALAAFSGYSLFISNKNKDLDEKLRAQLASQDHHLQTLQAKLESLDKIQLEMNEIRQQIGIIKLDKAYSAVQSTSINSYKNMAQKVNDNGKNEKKRIF